MEEGGSPPKKRQKSNNNDETSNYEFPGNIRSSQRGAKKSGKTGILDVLAANLKEIDESKQTQISDQKMEGDLQKMIVNSLFFVQGVRIGWPYPGKI